MMMIVQFLLSLFLISYVNTIDIIQVRVSNDSSNSWIVHNNNEGFIIDCGCYWEHGLSLANKWINIFPNGKLPSFIYLTHTHPDNFLGLVSLLYQLNVTELPVYVSNIGALNEMNYWLEIWRQINPFETSTLLDKRQSPDEFSYDKYITVLDRPLTIFNNEPIHILSNFPIAESIYSSMIYIPSINALFSGDLISIHSHLLVSPSDNYPESDIHVCNWIGILQDLGCTFPKSTLIYPTHGDSPTPMSFTETIETNIRWLTYMRALIFNSCNATFVMRILEDVFTNYSNIEQSRASIANRIPYAAVSVGCNCTSTRLSTCGGLQPPACQFLPKNRTISTKTTALSLACLQKQFLSSLATRRVKIEFLLNFICFFLLLFVFFLFF